MAFISKNSRVGRGEVEKDHNVLPKYVPGNVGTTWKTKGKYNPKNKGKMRGYKGLSWEIKSKR